MGDEEEVALPDLEAEVKEGTEQTIHSASILLCGKWSSNTDICEQNTAVCSRRKYILAGGAQ